MTTPPRSWALLAMLVVAYVLAFVDRQMLGLLVEPIKRDLGLSDVRVSLLQGLSFALLLSVAGLPIGRLVDRGRRVSIVSAGVAVWSVMTAACGLAGGYAPFALFRMGVGVGEAALTPAAYSMIGDAFPMRRQGLAAGLYNIGPFAGGGLALMLGGWFVSAFPEAVDVPWLGPLPAWRLALLAAGAPGLLVAAGFLLLAEPPRRDAPVRGEGRAADETLPGPAAHLRANARTYCGLYLGLAFCAMALYAAQAWVPSFLIRTYAMPPASVGRSYGPVFIVFGTLGAASAGVLGDALRSRLGSRARPLVMTGGALAAVPFYAAAPLMDSAAGALALLGPAAFFATLVIAAGPAALQEVAPARMRGTVHALSVLIVNVLGLGLGPFAVAFVTDHAIGDEHLLRYALSAALPAMLLVSSAFAVLAWTATKPKAWHLRRA